MRDKIIIDSHCHVFNYDCLPQVFQSRYLKGINPAYLKIFFGSDWWVNRVLLSETQYITHFLRLAKKYDFTENNLRSIIVNNAITFLGLNIPQRGPFRNYKYFMQENEQSFPGWFQEAFLS
jgi:hypothetical protein